MTDLNSLTMLYQRKQAQIASLGEKKSSVEGEVKTLNTDTSTAKTTLDNSKASLSDATEAHASFQIPDVIDKPDRASFTKLDDETGEEVFDEASFNAENEKYLESVKAHDEAVKKKEELQRTVQQKTEEVSSAETSYTDLTSATQNKEQELTTVSNNMDMSMRELSDLDAQIQTLKQEEQVAKTEASKETSNEVNNVANSEETEAKKDVTVDVPVQNNKGWEYYAKLELEAEHEGEEGYKPSASELNAKAKEVMQRNIENGNVNKKGDLVIGTPQNPKYVTLSGDVDTSGLQSTDQALVKYNQGQEILAEEARAKAEAEAEAKAKEEAAVKEREAAIKKGKKDAEAALKKELKNMSKEDIQKMNNAKNMSESEITKASNEVMDIFSKSTSVADEYGQDIGKITGHLAKKYGAKNAQKILGNVCNMAAKKAGKLVPGLNAASFAYGAAKVANGDTSGYYDMADVAVSYIPVIGTAISLIGTENIANVIQSETTKKAMNNLHSLPQLR